MEPYRWSMQIAFGLPWSRKPALSWGGPVSIAGDLEFQASLIPTLTATDVAVANPPDGSPKPMVRIGSLEIGLDVLDLLLGEVDITRIVVADAKIDLETHDDGTGNWVPDRKRRDRWSFWTRCRRQYPVH